MTKLIGDMGLNGYLIKSDASVLKTLRLAPESTEYRVASRESGASLQMTASSIR